MTETNPDVNAGTPPAEGVPAPAASAGGAAPAQEATPPAETPSAESGTEGQAPAGEPGKPSTEPQEKPRGLMHEEDEPVDDRGVLGAPEGEYEFKAPEGSELDPGVMKEFGSLAKELNLSQDAAQKIVERMAPSMSKSMTARINALRVQWEEASRNDPEFGGQNFEANLKGINRAYGEFTTPELRTLLQDSGLNNHPEMLRLFNKIAKATGESRYIRGDAVREREDAARKFYKGLK